jgi:hypothetical protein
MECIDRAGGELRRPISRGRRCKLPVEEAIPEELSLWRLVRDSGLEVARGILGRVYSPSSSSRGGSQPNVIRSRASLEIVTSLSKVLISSSIYARGNCP